MCIYIYNIYMYILYIYHIYILCLIIQDLTREISMFGPPGPKARNAGDVWSIGVAAVAIVALGTEALCLEGQPSTGSGYVLNGLLVFLNCFWWLLLILINGSSWFLNSVKVPSRN